MDGVGTPPSKPRGTHLTVTHGTHCHSGHLHPDRLIKHTWHAFPDYLKEDQATLINISSGRLTQYIRMIDISHPDTMVRIIDWSKASLTRYHNSLSCPTSHHLQSERTGWGDNKSLLTIILHDHFPRSLTAASPTTVSDSRQ